MFGNQVESAINVQRGTGLQAVPERPPTRAESLQSAMARFAQVDEELRKAREAVQASEKQNQCAYQHKEETERLYSSIAAELGNLIMAEAPPQMAAGVAAQQQLQHQQGANPVVPGFNAPRPY
jgi:hypothetical protein